MKIDKLEEISDVVNRNKLRSVYSVAIKIEDCQIDNVEYHGEQIRLGGYITVPVDKNNGAFVKGTYAYYWLELIDVSDFSLTSKYIFSNFTVTKEKDNMILETDSGLKIVAKSIELTSLTATWCEKLDNRAYL